MNKQISQTAAVHYSLAVLDSAGRVVRQLPRKKNLILDQGLNQVAANKWADCFRYVAIGTATTATRRDSGAVTVDLAAGVLTASAGFFEAADVGRLLKFDTGEEMYITGYTSPTVAATADARTIAAAEFTVWYVNQTALTTETKRTGTFATGSGAHGTSFAGNTLTMKRTFLFSAESGTVTYREIGWSPINTAGANLFGRDLLAGSGVTLVATQQLQVIVELSVSLSPATSTPYTNVVTGWSQDGDACIEYAKSIAVVQTNGDPGGDQSLEPSTDNKRWSLSTSTAALVAMQDAEPPEVNLDPLITATAQAYVAGSFFRDYKGKATVSQHNRTGNRSIFFGGNGSQAWLLKTAFRTLLDAGETKLNTHTLELTFRISWGRTLVN